VLFLYLPLKRVDFEHLAEHARLIGDVSFCSYRPASSPRAVIAVPLSLQSSSSSAVLSYTSLAREQLRQYHARALLLVGEARKRLIAAPSCALISV